MNISIQTQIVSFIGAMMILAGYAGQQLGFVDARKPLYSILNGVGSFILGVIAFRPFQLGFVVLEVAWVLVSIYGFMRALRERGPKPVPAD